MSAFTIIIYTSIRFYNRFRVQTVDEIAASVRILLIGSRSIIRWALWLPMYGRSYLFILLNTKKPFPVKHRQSENSHLPSVVRADIFCIRKAVTRKHTFYIFCIRMTNSTRARGLTEPTKHGGGQTCNYKTTREYVHATRKYDFKTWNWQIKIKNIMLIIFYVLFF